MCWPDMEEGRVATISHGHGGSSVAPDATGYLEISIHGYGLQTRSRYGVASWGGLGPARYVLYFVYVL
jgi:hypothetical protein